MFTFFEILLACGCILATVATGDTGVDISCDGTPEGSLLLQVRVAQSRSEVGEVPQAFFDPELSDTNTDSSILSAVLSGSSVTGGERQQVPQGETPISPQAILSRFQSAKALSFATTGHFAVAPVAARPVVVPLHVPTQVDKTTAAVQSAMFAESQPGAGILAKTTTPEPFPFENVDKVVSDVLKDKPLTPRIPLATGAPTLAPIRLPPTTDSFKDEELRYPPALDSNSTQQSAEPDNTEILANAMSENRTGTLPRTLPTVVHQGEDRGANEDDCAPTCHWRCDNPACNEVCKPVCQPPQCETRCDGFDLKGCTMDCHKPSCMVLCPKTLCPKQSCAHCTTSCAPSSCRLRCPNTQPCHSVCEEPSCDWQCAPSKECAVPSCSLECKHPPSCSQTKRLPLPKKNGNQVTVVKFPASVPTADAIASH